MAPYYSQKDLIIITRYRLKLKAILGLFILIAANHSASGQLPPGAMAPDFELVDINGQSHHLYEYLDDGKTVFLDFSTTWCVPCWQYHETHLFGDVYDLYGPAGTDQIVVLLIECDEATDINDLLGLTEDSMGDWIEDTDYPIINDIDDPIEPFGNSFTMGMYDVPAYPSFYHICPNRQAFHHYAYDLDSIESFLAYTESCISAQEEISASALYMEHLDFTCSPNVNIEVTFQNSGTEILSEATIELSKDDEPIELIEWEGDLATYELSTVFFEDVEHGEGEHDYEVVVSANGDANEEDNSLSGSIQSEIDFISENIINISFVVDQYPEELGWRLLDDNGQLIATEAPYNIDTGYSEDIGLGTEPNCFVLEITDLYGDGLLSGGYTIRNASDGAILVDVPAEDFNYAVNIHPFATEGFGDSVDELAVEYRVYPTFASDIIQILQSNNQSTSLVLLNSLGQILESRIVRGNQTTLQVSEYPSGLYYVKLGQGVTFKTFKVFID